MELHRTLNKSADVHPKSYAATATCTAHAILHTFYGMALRYDCLFLVEYFASDLIVDDEETAVMHRHVHGGRFLSPLHDPEFVQSHLTGSCLLTEGCRGEGDILRNSQCELFMAHDALIAKDLALHDVVSRAMTTEVREGSGVDAEIKFLAAEALHGIGGLAFDEYANRFANELGRRGCVTGKLWKIKPPFRLALNMASFGSHCLALQTLHRT